MSPISEKHEEVKIPWSLLLGNMREKGYQFYKRGGYTLEAMMGYASGTPDGILALI